MKSRKTSIFALLLLGPMLASCGGSNGSENPPPQAGGNTPTYTISYHANGATSGSPPSPASYKKHDEVTIAGNNGKLTITGHTFSGWNTAADGSGIGYASGATFTMGSADIQLFAQWTEIPRFTISYHVNGATSGSPPGPEIHYLQDSVTVAANIGNLARHGHAFDGWNSAADGSGANFPPASTLTMGNADITLYAQWVALPAYTFGYDSNGATSGNVPASETYYENDAVTIAANTGNLALHGYAFDSWNTAADGSGTNFPPASTLTMGNADVTLYAQWVALPVYTVEYDANGATSGSAPGSESYYENDAVTVAGNSGNLVQHGFTFAGWNTIADGTGDAYSSGASFNMGPGSVTLYAQWAAIPTYSVTYDGNGATGGTVPVDPNRYRKRQVVGVSHDTMSRTDYRFGGWNTHADGSGTSYIQGHVFAMGSADVTLYANWLPLTAARCTVSYDSLLHENGSPPDSQKTGCEYGSYFIALENTGGLGRAGFKFAGWTTDPDSTDAGIVYKPGDIIPMNTDHTFNVLYPLWTANPTYTVAYNGNGSEEGDVPVDTMNYEYGEPAKIHGNTQNLVKSGYKFKGWNTQPGGNGTLYNQPQTINVTSNVTLYAQWSDTTTYNVTYIASEATSGAVPVDTANYEAGQTITAFGNSGGLLNKTGYPATNSTKLTGWNFPTGVLQPGDSFQMDTTLPAGDLVATATWGSPLSTILYNAGTSNGNLGGRYGANLSCRSAIPTACSGRSKVAAFLNNSNATSSIDTKMTWNAGVNTLARVTGPNDTQISADWAGLFDGGIDTSLQSAGVLPASSTWWSGMYAPGASWIFGEHSCYYDKSWSSAASGVTGRAGSSSLTNHTWLGDENMKAICGIARYIVCSCSE